MCKWGTSVPLEVTIPAHLSSTGVDKRKVVDVDACIAPLVKALNDGGITTIASCCGHGHLPPNIILADDRWIVILSRQEGERLTKSYGVNIHGEAVGQSHPPAQICICGHAAHYHYATDRAVDCCSLCCCSSYKEDRT